MNWVITYKHDPEPVYRIEGATFQQLLQRIPKQFQGENYNVCPE